MSELQVFLYDTKFPLNITFNAFYYVLLYDEYRSNAWYVSSLQRIFSDGIIWT